ncbi:MAG: TfoX/Sxy family protein [Microthrixaceae bacterium]
MSYDPRLADRIRKHLADTPGVTERKMFGGLAFLLNGNMAVAANRSGGLMVRVDQAEVKNLLASTPARLVEMRGRQMQGWLHLDAEHVADEPGLAEWVEIGSTYAATLPAK